MTLAELVARLQEESGLRFTPRHVRFLISSKVCPKPGGGRKFAEYGEEHLKALREYRRLREMDFSLPAIRQLRKAKSGFPRPIVDGISLVIAPERLASGEPVEPLVEKVREVLTEALAPSAAPSPTETAAPAAPAAPDSEGDSP